MIKIAKPFLIATMLLLCLSCSSENDTYDTVFEPEPEGETPPVEEPPVIPSPPEGAVELPGFPKRLHKYENGILQVSVHYYFGADGNQLRKDVSYPPPSNAVITTNFLYDNEGKLIKLESYDYVSLYWEGDRITRAAMYEGAWNGRSEILYKYNTSGQIIQRTQTYLDWTPTWTIKDLFYYDEDGNLNSIENYDNGEQGGLNFKLSHITKFEDYTENENLFMEFEIIPGQRVQHYFPASQKSWNYNPSQSLYENFSFSYKYDEQGRVIEKIFGRNTIVYEYY